VLLAAMAGHHLATACHLVALGGSLHVGVRACMQGGGSRRRKGQKVVFPDLCVLRVRVTGRVAQQAGHEGPDQPNIHKPTCQTAAPPLTPTPPHPPTNSNNQTIPSTPSQSAHWRQSCQQPPPQQRTALHHHRPLLPLRALLQAHATCTLLKQPHCTAAAAAAGAVAAHNPASADT
jgi:hypothetical protein